MTDWLPTFYSAAGGNVQDLGPIDGINQWNNLKVLGTSSRKEMLYNSNPNGHADIWRAPTGSALRWGDMKLMIGEPGPGFVVQPGYYPNDSVFLTDQWSSEDNVSAMSNVLIKTFIACHSNLEDHFRFNCLIWLMIRTSQKTWPASNQSWCQICLRG